ncbi:hypothetical protein [Sporomusa acidovorans]|uniref:Double zinc ribbon n=1 Tax=Sporomusa acidovorans (strain ATCC 49682 / DSM 3132 / Mol) TaxID=1123286 RepID=A0ABZ3J5K9_SPOA4|nr:hypothetical protein [Sporomusa acidovorans]OZC15571.1 hypothetical protein SPACI_48750 [Sporomusa acidovorans DSM 3132]SDE18607.1 hypothetical protein SAMN04488499_1009104 [Sporomusa acidovorans]
MEKVCPLCNALQAIVETCPYCGGKMVDGGSISNYLGPYSPYMDKESLPLQSEDYCLHVIYCPVCAYDTRMALALVAI